MCGIEIFKLFVVWYIIFNSFGNILFKFNLVFDLMYFILNLLFKLIVFKLIW